MPHVTIPDQKREILHLNQTGTGPFAFSFVWFVKSDLRVYVNGALLPESQWSVTASSVIEGGNVGGQVTLTTAVAGATITIAGMTRPGRTDDIAVGGAKPQRLNNEFDKLHAVVLDLLTRSDRSLQFPPGSVSPTPFLVDEQTAVGKTPILQVIPNTNPAQYRFVFSDLRGPRGDEGPQGPVGPALNFVGSLNSSNDLPAAASVTVGTAYKIGADVWVRSVVAGAPAWVNFGPLTGSNLMTVRWVGNTIANAVSVINFTGAGVINVSSPSTGVVNVQIEPPAGAGAAVVGYAYVENWNASAPTITVTGFAGAQASQIEVEVNGRTLLNNGADWTGSASGADYVVTIPADKAKQNDSVAVRIVSTSAGGGGGGGATIYRQDEPPAGADDGAYWVDSNDQNQPYIKVSGQWVSVRDGRIGALESLVTQHTSDIAALDTRLDNIEPRVTAVEDANTSQASAISSIQLTNTQQADAISELQARATSIESVNTSQGGTLSNHSSRIGALESLPSSTPSNTAPGNANSVTIALAGGLSLKIQWGAVSVNDSSRLTLTLPVPFTSGFYAVSASYDGNSTTDERQVYASINPASPLTQIILTNTFNEVRAVRWIAIGF